MKEKIINELKNIQKKNGSFEVFTTDIDGKNKKISTSIFCTSVILSNISDFYKFNFLNKTANFLLKQCSSNNTWNYWDNKSKNYTSNSYPDDLDDSALAILAISKHKDLYKNLDKIKKGILNIEKQKKIGSGYNTWFVEKNADKHWFDEDPVVNANIILLRKHLNLEIDKDIVKKLLSELNSDALESKYYPNKIHISYFIIRACEVYNHKKIIKRLIKLSINCDVMTLSMILSSLVRLKYKGPILKKIYKKVFNMREKMNNIYPLYIESIRNDKINYVGSQALTLSFIYEALHLYESEIINKNIDNKIKERLVNLSLNNINVHTQVLKLLSKSLNYVLNWGGVSKIILLPNRISKFFQVNESRMIDKISTVGLLGWVAFTIDDQIRDKDTEIKADWVSIPVSNILKNRMYQLINGLSLDRDILTKVYNIISEMESVNKLEEDVKPIDFKKMEHTIKSMGLAIPTILLFNKVGNKSKFNTEDLLIKYFRYYISARQISDDLTDWREDLKLNKNTFVTNLVLKRKIVNDTDFSEILPLIAKRIIDDCENAINYSNNIFLKSNNPLSDLANEYIYVTRKELIQGILK